MKMLRLVVAVFVVPATAALTGCGGDSESYTLAPVSGVVKLNGEPLANATVSFQPVGDDINNVGPGSFGKTDAQGKFTLETVNTGERGPAVGNHRVSITVAADEEDVEDSDVADAAEGGTAKRIIPVRYNRESKLTFEVPVGGTDAAKFHLESN